MLKMRSESDNLINTLVGQLMYQRQAARGTFRLPCIGDDAPDTNLWTQLHKIAVEMYGEGATAIRILEIYEEDTGWVKVAGVGVKRIAAANGWNVRMMNADMQVREPDVYAADVIRVQNERK